MKEEKSTKKKVSTKSTKQPVKKETKKVVDNKENTVVIDKKESDMVSKNVSFNLLEVIIIIVITGVLVSIVSGFIVYKNYSRINIIKSNNSKDELSEFIENYNYIKNNYVEDVKDEDLIEGAIEGMYNRLNDGYSMYLSKDDTDSLEEQLSGEYTGVGIEIRSELKDDKYITSITRIFKNSPAQRAGLKKGDIITKIDDVEVVDASTIADTIKKGNKDTYSITYVRDNKEHTVELKRERVTIEYVTSEVYDKVGYIKIDSFSSNTKEQVKNAINSFDKKITSLVIDVRDNSGGYLTSAYETSDLFIEKGRAIYQLQDKNGNISKYYAKSSVVRKFNKIAVITNSGSASASEILALALRESAGAIIVGTKSYGKGTVQETRTLKSGAMVKYTTSYWLSPNGNSINKIGIVPDVEEKVYDNQLEKAIKAVK